MRDCWIRVVLWAALLGGCTRIPVQKVISVGEIHETLTDGKVVVVAPDQYTTYQRRAESDLLSYPSSEFFALEFFFPGAGPGGVVEIVVDPSQALIRAYDHSYQSNQLILQPLGQRNLTVTELGAFEKFVLDHRIDDLKRQEFGAWDGVEYRWTHLSKSGAWQVLLNNPQNTQHPEVDLLRFMRRLQDTKPLGGGKGVEIPFEPDKAPDAQSVAP